MTSPESRSVAAISLCVLMIARRRSPCAASMPN
jgi:hypothetical protein